MKVTLIRIIIIKKENFLEKKNS